MTFTNEEAFDMLMILGECHRNCRQAARLYEQRYPLRAHHSYNVFQRLAKRVSTDGVVQPTNNKGISIRRPVRNEKAADVLAAVIVNPHDSTRRISRDSGISNGTVWKILKDNKFHPYHIHLHQDLGGNDFQNRVNFCNWYVNTTHEFQDRILWTDEATFKSNGQLNIHNAHYWSQNNPHWLREVDYQHV